MNMNKKNLRIAITAVIVALGVILVVTNPFSYKANTTNNNSNNSNNSNPTPNPTSTAATGLNLLDSAGFVGAAVLETQLPWRGTLAQQAKFASDVQSSLNSSKPTVDVGVNGIKIVEANYNAGDKTACFAVTTGTVTGTNASGKSVTGNPFQSAWVVYVDHTSAKSTDYFDFIKQGVTSCDEAKKVAAAAKSSNAKHVLVTNTDNLLRQNLNVLPYSALTSRGLYLLDYLRGTVTPQAPASSSATPTPTGSKATTKKKK
jgi:hypothetical protein